MTIPPLTVRPIVHTAHPEEWLAVFRALGAEVLTADPMWTEVQFGRGRITLSELNRGAAEGEVALGFETPDLAAYAAAVRPSEGMVVEPFRTDDYESLRVVGRDGMSFLVDARRAQDPASDQAATSVRGLWIAPDVVTAAEDLESLGLTRRLTETNGRTIDLRAAEGDVLVHTSDGRPVAAGMAIDVTDIAAAHKALLDAGISHDMIDETHGRTLQLEVPSGSDRWLWIAEEDKEPVGVIRH